MIGLAGFVLACQDYKSSQNENLKENKAVKISKYVGETQNLKFIYNYLLLS